MDVNLSAADFVGQWQLDREITDHLGQMSGVFQGNATLTLTADTALRYAETGELLLESGAKLYAERVYLWDWFDDQVAVRFTDGAPFHSFIPAGRGQGTPHLCGDDLYMVAYDFRLWPDWEAVWQVSGPRKDYVSRSRYKRA